MVEKTSEQSIMDKSMRSVFVGNIPYGATEENLKEIFSEVGPVISLKLVYDRESGKPKGYGFCEYKDQETALSAMRNLNNYEIGGRTLRVDNACTEKSRMEMQQLLQASQVENPYGEYCEADNAPEAITKTVASLPPEQMYELMRQMKACIQNNPTEARQMLLLNPQLAYALLQAQVVMRIIDPQTALTMLYKANQMPPVLTSSTMQLPPVVQHQIGNQSQNSVSNTTQPIASVITANNNFTAPNQQDIDLRSISADPRIQQQQQQRTNLDLDMRSSTNNAIQSAHSNVMDTRNANINNPRPVPPPPSLNVQQQQQPFPTDPRQRPVDPRLKIAAQQQQQQQQQPNSASTQPLPVSAPQQPSPLTQQQQQQQPNALSMSNAPTAVPSPLATSVLSGTTTSSHHRIPAGVGIPHDASDQEKAALIMQVLQLSEEQIAMLPPEQRASILVLKEQIAKSTR